VITIRNFQPDDMFSVIKLASETLPEQYNPTLFNHFYETFPEGLIIVEKMHKIIGFIVGVKSDINIARILMLSISEKNRKQGLGSALLNQFLKDMTLQNIKQIYLEVRVDNKKAIKFYQKNGFKVMEIIPKFYQNGEDAYQMKKVI
jgi:ribosomal-protein-alanine N-acetyltransferase